MLIIGRKQIRHKPICKLLLRRQVLCVRVGGEKHVLKDRITREISFNCETYLCCCLEEVILRRLLLQSHSTVIAQEYICKNSIISKRTVMHYKITHFQCFSSVRHINKRNRYFRDNCNLHLLMAEIEFRLNARKLNSAPDVETDLAQDN